MDHLKDHTIAIVYGWPIYKTSDGSAEQVAVLGLTGIEAGTRISWHIALEQALWARPPESGDGEVYRPMLFKILSPVSELIESNAHPMSQLRSPCLGASMHFVSRRRGLPC